MKISFQADNDLNQQIVARVLRREPMIDFQTAAQANLHGLDDITVLVQSNVSFWSLKQTYNRLTGVFRQTNSLSYFL
jgi:hypothetical protein